MKTTPLKSMFSALVLLCGANASNVLAQEAAADAAPPPAKPHAAEIMPRATRGLLLAIASTGKETVAVGERGNILLSVDGVQWVQSPSPINSTLTAVGFADSLHGWAVGHDAAILHTDDAGKSWKLQNFQPDLQKPLLGLLVIDAQHAYAFGAFGLFLETADSGTKWTEVDAPAVREDGLHLSSMIRLNTGELLIAGEQGTLAVRASNGKWTKLNSPYEGSFYGALPWGAKGALVYGQRGNIVVTDDVHGGQWKAIDTKSKQGLFGGALVKDRGAVLVGADEYSVLIRPDTSFQIVSTPKATGATAGGTLSGVEPWKSGLLVVGEAGVKTLPLDAPAK